MLWWHMPNSTALQIPRQEDGERETILNYTMRSFLKIKMRAAGEAQQDSAHLASSGPR